jgi:hypothetical protein
LDFKEKENVPSFLDKLHRLMNVDINNGILTTTSLGSILTSTIKRVSSAMNVIILGFQRGQPIKSHL